MARIQVILFWKVELSPTYSSAFSIVRKVESMSRTINTGILRLSAVTYSVSFSIYSGQSYDHVSHVTAKVFKGLFHHLHILLSVLI